VSLIRDRGVSVAQASRDLAVHRTLLHDWLRAAGAAPERAFPGHGRMPPEQAEIVRLRREVTRLKAERDILEKAAAYFAKDQT
jgi:transposase